MLSPQEALVYTMVVAAEADHDIEDAEINLIGDLANHLPIFGGMDRAALTGIATACSEALAQPGGREQVLGQIRMALPRQLRDTAYALACDVIAIDRRLQRSEMHVLEWLRGALEVEPAMARAIE
jgi:uncharacterized membrane protein YebE (DUF533 family)